jgi:3-hydroxy acid dehydrogenase/malonic semialdehyde reductase
MNFLRRANASIRYLGRASSFGAFPSTVPTSYFRASRVLLSPFIKRTMASAMAKRLEGKTVVVTGASSGIGYSTAKEFARTAPKNLKIIVTARRVDKLEELAKEIKAEVGDGVKVLPVQLDVANPEAVKNFVPSLPAEFQDIHVLVNNA